jgi:hypothetical protein
MIIGLTLSCLRNRGGRKDNFFALLSFSFFKRSCFSKTFSFLQGSTLLLSHSSRLDSRVRSAVVRPDPSEKSFEYFARVARERDFVEVDFYSTELVRVRSSSYTTSNTRERI